MAVIKTMQYGKSAGFDIDGDCDDFDIDDDDTPTLLLNFDFDHHEENHLLHPVIIAVKSVFASRNRFFEAQFS